MDIQRPKPRLLLIPGGLSANAPVGPATRLGLWDRFPAPSKVNLAMLLAAKVLLLAAAFALAFRNS